MFHRAAGAHSFDRHTMAPCRSGMASVGTSTGSPSTGRSSCAGRKQQENASSRSRVKTRRETNCVMEKAWQPQELLL
jgi:hypothetical protein